MTKERRLGRGLAALLGSPVDDSKVQPTSETVEQSSAGGEPNAVPHALPDGSKRTTLPDASEAKDESKAPRQNDSVSLNVYEIDDNPFQPRREFNEPEIASLAESLKEHDMLQPVLVRRMGDRFQLISGERRLRAAIQAGWSRVPARIRDADDRLVAELAIVENLQRKDLNPIEKAMSFKRYLEEHGCTQDDLARRLKIDRSTIANLMRLLELPREVLDRLRKGEISAGHSRALLPLGDEEDQIEFAERICKEGLSVRETERQVTMQIADADQADIIPMPDRSSRRAELNKNIVALEHEFRMALGTRVDIKQSARGRGRIVLHFANHDEFEQLRETVTGKSARTEAA